MRPLLPLALAAAACGSPDHGLNQPCGPNGECDTGFTCVASTDLCGETGSVMGTVTVVPMDPAGAPATGTLVAIEDSDGTPLGVVISDGAGATHDVVAGDAITIASDSSLAGKKLITILGVTPGSTVPVQIGRTQSAGVFGATLTYPTASGAASYRAEVPCSSGTSSMTSNATSLTFFAIDLDCVVGGNFQITLTARDAGGAALDAQVMNVAAPAANGTATVMFAAWPGVAPASFHVTVLNPPAQLGTYGTCSGTPTGCAQLYGGFYLADGRQYLDASLANVPLEPGQSSQTTFQLPTTEPIVQYQANLQGIWNGAVFGRSRKFFTTLADVSLDLAATVAPLTGATADTSDPTRPTVTFTRAATPAPTAMIIGLHWSNGTTTGNWFIVAPATQGSPIRFPALPPEMAAWTPTADATFMLGTWAFGSSELASYADFLGGGFYRLQRGDEAGRADRITTEQVTGVQLYLADLGF